MRGLKGQKGLTIMEMLMATLILTIVGTLTTLFFIQGSNLWESITGQSDLRSVARNALTYMSQELRNATRTGTGNPSPNMAIPSKPNNHSIGFYLPADLDGNGLIIDTLGATEWDTSNKIHYQYVPGQNMLRRLEKGNQFIISHEVANIEFEDNSIDSSLAINEVRIKLTLQRILPQNKIASVTMASIVKLRNQ
ncbi:MAG: hypothetical protein V1923_06350 [Candidatus Omnitrophota bacterium]